MLKSRVSLARQNRHIRSCVQHDDLADYQEKIRAAQAKYAVNAAPAMYLKHDTSGTIDDMASRLSVHEDVLRAYLGIDDDDREQHYICAFQSQHG